MLKDSFYQQRADLSPQRLKALTDMLLESKTGQQTSDFMKKTHLGLHFQRMSNAYGYFDRDQNKVFLNPVLDDADLATTLVHEARHAWQENQMDVISPTLSPANQFVSGYALEADACMTEVVFAHEMREKNPELWKAQQNSLYAPIGTAFEKTLNETKDMKQAKESAFLAWYSIPEVKETYADNYVDRIISISERAVITGRSQSGAFTENKPAEIFAEAWLKDGDGKSYLSDASKLESKDVLTLTAYQAKKMSSSLIKFCSAYNMSPKDLGLDKMMVKEKTGEEKPFMKVYNEIAAERAEKQKNKDRFLVNSVTSRGR